ncbi:hypothetical protein CGSHiHH_01387 [Haemophilus influenzae PittHH]|nr:hypothetical protein CGSHiHH_01387 [Haemophilus influenzae PittHH]
MRLINTNVKMGNKGECAFFIVKTTNTTASKPY